MPSTLFFAPEKKIFKKVATEGIGSLQLANAILLSEWTGETVNLPIDAARYESLLREKIKGSNLRVPADTDVEIDMEKSFR